MRTGFGDRVLISDVYRNFIRWLFSQGKENHRISSTASHYLEENARNNTNGTARIESGTPLFYLEY